MIILPDGTPYDGPVMSMEPPAPDPWEEWAARIVMMRHAGFYGGQDDDDERFAEELRGPGRSE